MVKVDDYEVPDGLYYSENWAWLKIEDGKVRVGITDYAQKQLNEVVFAELPSPEDDVVKGEAYGTVESVKSVSDLVAPVSGKIVEVNEKISDNPATVNDDPYGEGWLIVVKPSNLEADLKALMDFKKSVEWHRKIAQES
jgi:glycine cleavage system H protein